MPDLLVLVAHKVAGPAASRVLYTLTGDDPVIDGGFGPMGRDFSC